MTGTGLLAPRPGAAPLHRMVLAQTRLELTLMLRNGEQLLLLLVVPALLLVVALVAGVVPVSGRRVDFVAPGVLALAVMSTAFTGQAIATGFDRRYGVLKRLGATPLPRFGLVAAKVLAVLAVEVVQILLLAGLALALGWRPDPAGSVAAVPLVISATAAFTGLGLLMAGTLRAEATLAAANLFYLLLLAGGGVLVPLTRFPEGVAALLRLTPLAALADGLRGAFAEGALSAPALAILAAWAVAAIAAAALTFRWE